MQNKNKFITNEVGCPIDDNDNSKTAGFYGPVTLDDTWLVEKLAHFDRERIPERVVHAKGAGAYGKFTVTHDITKYTKAKLFSEIGKETPVFLRFSTVAGEAGSADVERDPRGFAIKFYTEEGNWDLVGNNTPVFFIRDAIKFPDFIHSQKRDPRTNLRSNNMMWDFWSHSPESLHQVTILMSSRGIPDGYRHMNGYGSHTFSMINANNERVFVKFHFKTQQGIKNLTQEEANRIASLDRDSATRDLYNAIDNKDFPRWTLKIQVLTEEQLKDLPFNPFDVTKVWPHSVAPLIEVGVLELNEVPDNYFNHVEQAAFSPAHVVPGISFSPDRMLQGRIFSYGDTQRYRLGINHDQIPVNRPRCPYATTHRGGYNNQNDYKDVLNYAPNSYNQYNDDKMSIEPGFSYGDSHEAMKYDFRKYDTDYFSQPLALFNLFDDKEKDVLATNIANSMAGVDHDIIMRQLKWFKQISFEYGNNVAKKLNLTEEYVQL
ncbi:catalase [Ureaplasma ceti]|uniref:Catalase n=1 Tax=Ureaplasma ceti TaxID=3119530 RepID=A0ABP9U8I1_9BACT